MSIASSLRELPREHLGLALALAGVLAFSLTLPMTRTAVRELDPWFLAFGRMSIAGIVAALWLIASGARRPGRAHLPLLAWASLGIVIGFPLLTSIAMQTIPANHGAVINGALPFATAVLAGAVGYVAGGRAAGRIGGVATILWALVLALPLTLPATLLAIAQDAPRAGLASWAAFAYVTLISQLVGFPLLTSIAMQTIPANHGAIINGALPFATAVLAAWAFGERHHRRFWICAAVGSLMVVAFALRDGLAARGTLGLSTGDLAMIAAVLAGAVGYVAGGRAAGRIGGVATILWALVLALPLTLPATLLAVAQETPRAGLASWAAFAYVTLISQLVGFFAWYHGLALAGPGGIGRVGQVQLLQVFFTVGFAWLLFGEAVHPTTWLFALGVVATIALGRRPARVG